MPELREGHDVSLLSKRPGRAWRAWCLALLLAPPGAGAATPPAPGYTIGDQNIGISGGPFRRPEDAAAHIEAVYLQIPWPVVNVCGNAYCNETMYCTARAAVLHDADFHEAASPYYMSAATAAASVVTTTPQCVRTNAYGQCLAHACMTRQPIYSYRMNAVCPSSSLSFREQPNRCDCGPDRSWHAASGSCKPAVDIDLRKARPMSCAVGNPFYPLTGLRRQTVPLGFEIGGVALTLSYTSATELPGSVSTYASAQPGLAGFGPMWSGKLHRYLLTAPGLDLSRGLVAVRGDGLEQTFVPDAGNALKSADAANANALWGYSVYVDRAAMRLETHWAGGSLQVPMATHFARGGWLSHGYAQTLGGPEVANAWGPYLVRVSDHFGRSVRFEYGIDPGSGGTRVQRIVRPDGLPITLSYSQGLLAAIEWPDGSTQSFLYQHPSRPRLLTGRVDETGRQIGFYSYDDDGLATATSGPGGVGAYTVQRATPPQVTVAETYDPARQVVYRTQSFAPAAWTRVTDPLGSTVTLTPAAASGDAVGSRDQPAGAGCDAATRSTVHDERGNVVRSDDFVGVRVCRAHDALNRETARVEGLAGGPEGVSCPAVLAAGAPLPAGSRKISLQWHPLWPVPEKLAEPGMLTTYVYNGRPDPFSGGATASCAAGQEVPEGGGPVALLCREVRQASADADGSQGLNPVLQAGVAARTRRWTYNASGQVLSATDPLDHTTLYAYHPSTTAEVWRGDLMQVTSPAGHVTRYTRYDKLGQPLEMVDANGVVTRHTYDLRQRLTSTSVGGETTRFAYWPHGLIQRITRANGSWVHHDYDDAQRLIRVSDSLGNSVGYTLDNFGQRVAEAVRDPAGMLRRQLSRSIDALGRVQVLTGRE